MIKRKGNIYKLDTKNTSLILRADDGGAEYVYYGPHISTTANYDILTPERDWTGTYIPRSVVSAFGRDFRESAVKIRYADGSFSSDFRFSRAQNNAEMPDLSPMPSCRGESMHTLRLEFSDGTARIRLNRYYTVFDDSDVIVVSSEIVNRSHKPVRILRLSSLQLDLFGTGYTVTTFDGSWGSERQKHTAALQSGVFVSDSKTGSSSPFHNPFIMLSDKQRCYAFNLIYSGNHSEIVEADEINGTRVLTGLGDFMFDWELAPGEVFRTPQAVMTCAQTETELSLAMHSFVLEHVIPKKWKNRERPILVNNWEGTEFRFNREKILQIAKRAAQVGAELFVLDDGWFGKRDDDTSSLGDWTDYVEKTGGIGYLSAAVRNMGMKFGIWVEPEMISENSVLYEKHADYAMKVPFRTPVRMRNQLMLNLADERVQNYVVRAISAVINECKASYVKWDYNRFMTDCYGKGVAGGEYYHRYMLGLYSVFGRLTAKFPEVLFESCASGGGRFDLGMLAFMPQTWTSDNTDARERLAIQAGTSYGYPQHTMGSHVSASPNLQTGNSTPLETRFNIACGGLLGYEMDMTKCNEAEMQIITEQIAFYKKYRNLLQFGTHYRLGDAFLDNVCGYMVVSADQDEAIAVVCVREKRTGRRDLRFHLVGLDPAAVYSVTQRKQSNYGFVQEFTVGGDVLMNGYLTLEGIFADKDVSENSNPLYSRMYILKRLSRYKKGKQK